MSSLLREQKYTGDGNRGDINQIRLRGLKGGVA
jgi:hypothetical protein